MAHNNNDYRKSINTYNLKRAVGIFITIHIRKETVDILGLRSAWRSGIPQSIVRRFTWRFESGCS